MPDKQLRMKRAGLSGSAHRPRLIAIAGDSAAGKTTLSAGLVAALSEERSIGLCVDDYHRYDRQERKGLSFTPLHPDCNYIEIMEQHLQLLATGESVLKPVYDHSSGQLVRPELVEPRDFVIVEGLLPLHTALARACFDVTVYLDPPEAIRREWKVARDTRDRGYAPEQVLEELERREPESEGFIRPQRDLADIVIQFAPVEGRHDPPSTPLSATLLLRPNVRHPNLSDILSGDEGPTASRAIHLKLMRDANGKPVDALHIHGHASSEETAVARKLLWEAIDGTGDIPEQIGSLGKGKHSEPLALTQLVLLYYLLANVNGGRG